MRLDDSAEDPLRTTLDYLLLGTANAVIAGGADATETPVVAELAKLGRDNMVPLPATWVEDGCTVDAGSAGGLPTMLPTAEAAGGCRESSHSPGPLRRASGSPLSPVR